MMYILQLTSRLSKVSLMLLCSLNASCATIISGKQQFITVSTTVSKDFTPISGSRCQLVNSKGEWIVSSPQSIEIRKSYGDLSINCTKGELKGSKTIKSFHEGIVWGNILFGALLGWFIDVRTGAGFKYTTSTNVQLN